jgi:hypothetical protein
LKVEAPGNFESTLGIDAGIALTLGERRLKGFDGDGARELTALLDESLSSCNAKRSLSPFTEETVGTTLDELMIVVRSGLVGRSPISAESDGMGI